MEINGHVRDLWGWPALWADCANKLPPEFMGKGHSKVHLPLFRDSFNENDSLDPPGSSSSHLMRLSLNTKE